MNEPGTDVRNALFRRAIETPSRLKRGRSASVLVAGIGDIFLGDNGFGVEVVEQLYGRMRAGAD
jgi:hypothetical protein